jgi:hypothetical protein
MAEKDQAKDKETAKAGETCEKDAFGLFCKKVYDWKVITLSVIVIAIIVLMTWSSSRAGIENNDCNYNH